MLGELTRKSRGGLLVSAATLSIPSALAAADPVVVTGCDGGPPPPSGMVAWWPMDELDGGKVVDIVSGLDGTVFTNTQSSPIGDGKVHGSLQYHRTNGHQSHYGLVPHDPKLDFGTDTDFTIDAWVSLEQHWSNKLKRYTRDITDYVIVSKAPANDGSGVNTVGYAFSINKNGQLKMRLDGPVSETVSATSADPIIFGYDPETYEPVKWAHVAVRVDRDDDITFFINGLPVQKVENGPLNTQHVDVNSPSSLLIMPGLDSRHASVNQGIDELEIFNRALTDAEILQIAAQGKCKPFTRTYTCVAPPPDMDAWFPFDGNNDDLALGNDAVSNSGVSYTEGMVGQAVRVRNGLVALQSSPARVLNQGLGDFSFDAWIKFAPQGGVRKLIEKRRNKPDDVRGYLLYLHNNRYGLQLGDGDWTNQTDARVIDDGEWHHVAYTVDRDNPEGLIFYIDGAAGTPLNPSSRQGSLDNTAPMYFGRDDIDVEFDEVEFFDRVLSAEEIAAIYNAGPAGKCKPGSDISVIEAGQGVYTGPLPVDPVDPTTTGSVEVVPDDDSKKE